MRVAHGRDTSPSVSTDAQQSTHCNSLRETRIFECAAGNYATALRAASYKCPIGWNARSEIIGPTDEITRFRTAHIRNDQNGELQLDFDSIIPMPPELRDTDAAPSDAFIWALGGELYAARNLSRRLGYETADATPLDRAWVRELGIISREGMLNWAEVNRPHKFAVAKRVMEVERATGYRNWYDWRCVNWGCKWGCAGFVWLSDDQTAFLMSTPWSAPIPIFKKLVELFPTLTFACHFVEECDGIDETEIYATQ